MADPPEVDKLGARVLDLEAEVAELRAEAASLRVHLSARDQTNAALARYVDVLLARVAELAERERERAGQAATDAAAAIEGGGGCDERDDVREILGDICATGIEVAAEHGAPNLGAACRWLRRTLDERCPRGDVIAAAITVAWHWRGLEVRHQERFRRVWAELWKDSIRARDEIPRKLGALKRGKTKVDPATVVAYYKDQIKAGVYRQIAKAKTVESFKICDRTLRSYLKGNRED